MAAAEGECGKDKATKEEGKPSLPRASAKSIFPPSRGGGLGVRQEGQGSALQPWRTNFPSSVLRAPSPLRPPPSSHSRPWRSGLGCGRADHQLTENQPYHTSLQCLHFALCALHYVTPQLRPPGQVRNTLVVLTEVMRRPQIEGHGCLLS